MRILILSDLFSLDSWLIHDQEPEIMPAVYELFRNLGASSLHSFDCIMFHQTVRKTISFPNGSTIEIHPLSIAFHYPRKFFSLFAMRGLAKRRLSQQTYDVIYGMSIYSVVAAQLGTAHQLPSVARLFGSLIYDVMRRRQYFKLYTRYILQYAEAKYPCDLIICTEDGTEFDRALEIIQPGQEVTMLHNGISDKLRKKLLSYDHVERIDQTKKIRLVSIGRLTQWKRHELCMQVLQRLRNEHELDAALTIIGRGELKGQLKRKARKLSIAEHVIFKEGISHKDMPEEIASHDIGLFLYDASNLGNALWETALSGRLLVLRDTGKTAKVFRHGENALVVQDDPVAIASTIASFLNKDVSAICQHGRDTVNALLPSWEERIDEEMSLISTFIDQKC